MHDAHTDENSLSLFAIVAVILSFGLIMLGSATAPIGAEKYGSAYYFLFRQVVLGVIPGTVLFIALRQVSLTWWERSWKLMFALSIILLGLVFIPHLGARINGSLSWIHIGSFTLQPAELVKFTFIAFLAGWLANNKKLLARPFTEGLLLYLLYVVAICGMLLLQPDLGTALVFFATAVVMAFIAGAEMNQLGVLAAFGVGVVIVMVAIAPYRLERITVIFNPDKDPLGGGYHIKQSLIAIGSGGPLGLGFGNSRQKFQYLPEAGSDSIFAIIAEEMGFVISGALIVAYFILVLKGYALARRVPSEWAKYFIIGTVSWIGVQVMLNIGAMLAIVPLTGLPLPLVSHGGSSVMMTLAAFGVISAIISPPEQMRVNARKKHI
ncbi:MAG: putative peptidoglycan glycosyltransferase FtsW [Candidatus Magasanikbacteria bacterium]|nr:putative peptidoglycan glycosyltransferase FtsW [Candidatus Magasanikbacteria bacterium]